VSAVILVVFIAHSAQLLFQESNLFLLSLHEPSTKVFHLGAKSIVSVIRSFVIAGKTDLVCLGVDYLLHLSYLSVGISSVLSSLGKLGLVISACTIHAPSGHASLEMTDLVVLLV